jgi:hypothetical protein
MIAAFRALVCDVARPRKRTTMQMHHVGLGTCNIDSARLEKRMFKYQFSAQTPSATTQSSSYTTACPRFCRVTTTDTSSCLSPHTYVVSGSRCRSTPRPSAPASSSCACSWCRFCPSAILFNLPLCCLFPCLFLGSPALSCLLTMRLFLFNVD